MEISFSLGFAEKFFTIDGNTALHLVCKSSQQAAQHYLVSFDVVLRSHTGKYSQSFSVLLPEGQTQVSVPFVPPLSWADDFAENIGDLAYPAACGQFTAGMTAHISWYNGTSTFSNDYSGYCAALCATVDESILPDAGTLSAAAADGIVPESWGVWLAGKSIARVTALNAAGNCGSRIIGYTFGNLPQQSEAYADIPLNKSGAITIPVTVTDSRLRTATADLLLEAESYTPAALSGIRSTRCDAAGNAAEEGAYFLASCTLSGSTVAGHNPISAVCAWKKVTENAYGTPVALTPGTPAVLAANLEPGASYDVKYTVSDTFGSTEYYDYVSSAVYLLHFLKGGTGIAVGKAAEQQNLFDVALDTKLRRDAAVGGDLAVAGTLTVGGTDVGDVLGKQALAAGICAANTDYFSAITENAVQKCGHLVLCRLHGTMTNNGGPAWEGESYHIATLPAGFYNTAFAAPAFACQNGKPCKAYTDTAGKVYVVPAADGCEDTEVYIIGMV